jgi:hypothetical protein
MIAMARRIAIMGTPMPTEAPMAAFIAVLRPEEAVWEGEAEVVIAADVVDVEEKEEVEVEEVEEVVVVSVAAAELGWIWLAGRILK